MSKMCGPIRIEVGGVLTMDYLSLFYRPATPSLVGLGPCEPKLLTKTQAFAIFQACYSATYGRIVPKMPGGLLSPPLHNSTKFRENPLSSVCVIVRFDFLSCAIAPPMGRAGSKLQAFFLFPPYITPPNFVQIGAIFLELS